MNTRRRFFVRTALVLVFAFATPTVARMAMLQNPLPGISTANDLYIVLIRSFLGVIGLVSLVFFIWGGFRLMTSAGSPEVVKKSKDTLLYALLGMVIVILSYSIVQYVYNVLIHG